MDSLLSLDPSLLQTLHGPAPHFVNTVDSKYYCAACRNLLQPPVSQTHCGHRLCARCVDQLFETTSTPQCPAAQEEDCGVLVRKNIHPDRATTKELLRMRVYCTHHSNGCDVTVKWGELTQHAQSCTHAPVSCTYVGCNVSVSRGEYESHVRTCDYRPIQCEQCGEQVPHVTMSSKQHEITCTPKPRPCIYSALGCGFVGLPDELQQHKVTQSNEHTATHVTQTLQLRHEVDKLVQNVQDLKSHLETHESKPNGLATPNLLKSLSTANQNITLLTKSMQDKAEKRDLQEATSKFSDLQDVCQMHESRLTYLEERNHGGGGGTGETNSTDTSRKVQQMESTIGMLDVRLAEYELRFRLLETGCHNGRMTWKITNYSRRKQDALDGRTLSLYSQPFYTSDYGYKMCARVYLNGDGMGKGTHMSLFFVVMRGEYDALLPWPFRQRVTLALLDQSGARRHINDTFRPDPTSTSFRRPPGEMNIASGSPLFAANSVVESDRHLKDDTIFIRVTVDTTDMGE